MVALRVGFSFLKPWVTESESSSRPQYEIVEIGAFTLQASLDVLPFGGLAPKSLWDLVHHHWQMRVMIKKKCQ